MKKLFVVIIYLILVGCQTPERVVNDAPFVARHGEEKTAISARFFSNGSVKLIATADAQNFYTINEWYDVDTVLYSVGENGMSSLYLHNFFTGKKALFYQSEEFIVKVKANANQSLFALQTLDQSGKSHLRILNKMGNEVYSWSKMVEELQFMWNPYVKEELIITEFINYIEFQLFQVDVANKKIKSLPVSNPFVQWTSKEEIGYLNWDQNEPSLEAPLLLFNVNTHETKKWLEKCMMLFSLKDVVITVSVDQMDLQKSLYTFYDAKTHEKLSEIYIPILNTFSEAWWIPSYDFDSKNKLFYYLKPYRSGDITEYDEGYQLTMLAIEENKEIELTTVSNNLPIKLSPNGQWCLIGQQLEQVLNIENGQIYQLVKTTN